MEMIFNIFKNIEIFLKNRISLIENWIENDFNFVNDKNNKKNIYYQIYSKSVKYEKKS